MLVSARTTFAIRCPQCGQMELSSVSRFELARGRTVKLSCSCGGHTLTIGSKGGKVFLQVPCYLCDGVHYLYFGPRSFWNSELEEIACGETNLQLGVFGDEESVEGYAHPGATELERLLEDAAFDDYFDHREVMTQALAHIHSLEDAHSLSCHCGGREVGIDIFPDHLELTCEDCGEELAIKAQNEDDLAVLCGLKRIEIGVDIQPRRKGHHKK